MPAFPPVLMLHHVEPMPLVPAPLHANSYLSRREFAAFLDQLAAGGFRTVTLAEACLRSPLPRRAVVLTFDDGCSCFADHAWPELSARGMTATLFALSGALGGSSNQELRGTNRWDRRDPQAMEREERLLNGPELAALARAGVEIGCHGKLHRDLTACSDTELEDEVATSRRELSAAVGQPVATFCFPYGQLDPRARAAVERAGYLAAVSIHGAANAKRADRLALPRMIVNPGESAFERRIKASGLYPLWSRLPRLGILRALRAFRSGVRRYA
ncbi:MAG: polysaccharide deacetylase family protein [Acidobacteriota bacterium]